MPQVPAEWEPIKEFNRIAEKLIARYPERWSGIDPDWLIAYGCTNKDQPDDKRSKPYDMSGETEPESFTNSKKYFIKMFMSSWEGRDDICRQWLVLSALERIDKENPDSGKITGLDYKDQGVIVRTIGADWHTRSNLPDILKDNIELVEDVKLDNS